MFRRVLSWGVLGAALLLGAAFYRRNIRRAYRRVQGRSRLLPTRYGDLEYTEGGTGSRVLVSHGSGGGFDQGELIAQALLGDRFHWLAPSRFGYLRSSCPAGATFDDQAHAYAALLDHLGVERVALIAVSHGGPSALLFATLYPERISSLALISAGVVSLSTKNQARANQKGGVLTTFFRYDWRYWAVSRFKKQMLALMGAPAAVTAALTPEQRRLAERLIDEMNPVSLCSAGVLFDHRAALPGDKIAAVQAPTLIIHAADDTLQLYANAEFAAAKVPGARLLRFEHGGYLVMATKGEVIGRAVRDHILQHAGKLGARERGEAQVSQAAGVDITATRIDERDVSGGLT